MFANHVYKDILEKEYDQFFYEVLASNTWGNFDIEDLQDNI